MLFEELTISCEIPFNVGVQLIAAERLKQVHRRGFTAEHDKEHGDGQLAEVAAVVAARSTPVDADAIDDWGILRKHPENRISQLAIAGALIAAEIERLLDKEGVGPQLIAAERLNQVYRCGHTAEYDEQHTSGELAATAAIVAAYGTPLEDVYSGTLFDDWGILTKHRDNRVSQLAIAGALIAAEIERLLNEQ